VLFLPTAPAAAAPRGAAGAAPPPPPPPARRGASAAADMLAAMRLVVDPEPAVAANGLRALARGVEAAGAAARRLAAAAAAGDGDAAAAAAAAAAAGAGDGAPSAAALVELALRQLSCPDSYVYLGAVELLRALAGEQPRAALPLLLRAYAGEGGAPLPPRARMKLGEALSLAARAAGASGVLPAYAPALLGVFLRVGVGGWRAQGALAARLLAAGERAPGAPPPPPPSPLEAPFFAPGAAPRDAAHALNAALALQDAAALRASALGCLGEVAAQLGASLPAHCGDVVGGLCGVLRWEAQPRAPSGGGGRDERAVAEGAAALVRRAAALALRRLLGGRRALEHVAGEGLMGDLYEALQQAAAGDADQLVRAHARDALAEVDDAVGRIASSTRRA